MISPAGMRGGRWVVVSVILLGAAPVLAAQPDVLDHPTLRQDLLDAAAPLVAACQTSPTLCEAYRHAELMDALRTLHADLQAFERRTGAGGAESSVWPPPFWFWLAMVSVTAAAFWILPKVRPSARPGDK